MIIFYSSQSQSQSFAGMSSQVPQLSTYAEPPSTPKQSSGSGSSEHDQIAKHKIERMVSLQTPFN